MDRSLAKSSPRRAVACVLLILSVLGFFASVVQGEWVFGIDARVEALESESLQWLAAAAFIATSLMIVVFYAKSARPAYRSCPLAAVDHVPYFGRLRRAHCGFCPLSFSSVRPGACATLDGRHDDERAGVLERPFVDLALVAPWLERPRRKVCWLAKNS